MAGNKKKQLKTKQYKYKGSYNRELFCGILRSIEYVTHSKKELIKMFSLHRCHVNAIIKGSVWNLDEDILKWMDRNNVKS